MTAEISSQRTRAGRDAFVTYSGDINVIQDASEDFDAPFLVVDGEFLDKERQKPKVPYIARPPLWADVVHGENPDCRFLAREQLGNLTDSIERQLLEPLRVGSDRRLQTLFVTGAPGCGKSTLVRHAAATLTQRGGVVVADLGVNHGRLIADELDSYVRGLARLAAAGTPVLLLMDDPFFANSGWDLLLETLARPSYTGIGVLGASPTYLYETYARPLAGHQIVLNTFPLGATTSNERSTLAEMYGVRDTPAIDRAINRHEDLLVFAMETASGSSFVEIIERIWSTLNDGRTIAPRSGVADVEWPVVAFLLTSYMHRHYVMCPESLLRAYMTILAPGLETDFAHELGDLTLSEGWHIFRVSRQEFGSDQDAVFGTMHARVAERAWQVRPFKTIDQVDLLARASAQAPKCAPQLAEFIFASQSAKDNGERRLVRKLTQAVAEEWRDASVSTAWLSALVHELRSSPLTAMPFRTALRERLGRRDSESWLAVSQLINLERKGSEERSRLEQTVLPYCLTLADLSLSSSLAIDLFGRSGSPRRPIFIARLIDSLEGRLAWDLDGTLLVWLLRSHGAKEILSLLPHVYDWLERHPEAQRARVALLEWYTANVETVGSSDLNVLLDMAREWVNFPSVGQGVVSAFFKLVATMLNTQDAMSAGLLEEISSWLYLRPDDTHLRERFLWLVAKYPSRIPGMAARAIDETLSWLEEYPEANDARRALLGLVLVELDHPHADKVITEALTWLGRHPDDKRVHAAWTALLRSRPAATVNKAMVEMLAWLGAHLDEDGTSSVVQALAREVSEHPQAADIITHARMWLGPHPDDARFRAGLLALVLQLPGRPDAAELITDAREWLREHESDSFVRGPMLALAHAMPLRVPPAEVISETLTWLGDHPDDADGHAKLLELACSTPGYPEAARVVTQTLGWPGLRSADGETLISLFRLVRLIPGNPQAAEVITAARQWLADRPDDSHIRTSLLGFIRVIPGHPQADEVIAETRSWLDSHPDDVNVRVGLPSLVRAVSDTPPTLDDLEEARAWLDDHPDDHHARVRMLNIAQGLARYPQAVEVITQTRDWLTSRPESSSTRVALFRLVRETPGQPQANEIISETRKWLAEHPDDSTLRSSLLRFVRELPGSPQADEVIAEACDWLEEHPDDSVTGALKRLLAPESTALESQASLQELSRTLDWLADNPDDHKARARAIMLARILPGHPSATEIIGQASEWLDDHPAESYIRAELLHLIQSTPEHPGAAEAISEALQWLDANPQHAHLRLRLLSLIRDVPSRPGAAAVINQTREWLATRPSNVHVRRGLLRLARRVLEDLQAGDVPDETRSWLEEIILETRLWLLDYPNDYTTRVSLLGMVRAFPTYVEAEELAREAGDWLDGHPGVIDLRIGLLALARDLPGHPMAAEISSATRQWLNGSPEDNRVRQSLLAFARALPERPEVETILAETRSWLDAHPSNANVRLGMLGLARAMADHSAAQEIMGETRTWLSEHAGHPQEISVRMGLLALVQELPGSTATGEVIAEARAWADEHSDDGAGSRLLPLLEMLEAAGDA